MLTPQQNLEEAARLLDEATAQFAKDKESGCFTSVEDATALANSRITLALALNAVPLIGEVRDDYADLRGPGRLGPPPDDSDWNSPEDALYDEKP